MANTKIIIRVDKDVLSQLQELAQHMEVAAELAQELSPEAAETLLKAFHAFLEVIHSLLEVAKIVSCELDCITT